MQAKLKMKCEKEEILIQATRQQQNEVKWNLIKSSHHVIRFAEYLSSKDPNIRFSYYLENQNILPFLDMNVLRATCGFSSTVHRKNTFSGVYMQIFDHSCLKCIKMVWYLLFYIGYNICSTFQLIHNEIENLGYPSKFFDKCKLLKKS